MHNFCLMFYSLTNRKKLYLNLLNGSVCLRHQYILWIISNKLPLCIQYNHSSISCNKIYDFVGIKQTWRSTNSKQPMKFQTPSIQTTLMTSLCLLQKRWEKEKNAEVHANGLIELLFYYLDQFFSLLTWNTLLPEQPKKKIDYIWAIMTMYREEHESWMMDHYGFLIFTLY